MLENAEYIYGARKGYPGSRIKHPSPDCTYAEVLACFLVLF